jgi:osmotically-inducible protein OsmY
MADDANLGGPYARDTHRGGFGDDYARDTGWSGGARHDDYVRDRGYRGRGPRNYRRSDERLREQVCEALTDDPRVDAREIDVKVENEVVTLTGRVRDRAQKRRAEDVALACTGVHDVMNALRVSAADDEVEIGKASE